MEEHNNKQEEVGPEQLAIPLVEDEYIVRPELNTAKFADFLFPPSHSKNLRKSRTKKWQGMLPNGKRGDVSLRVSPPESFKAPSHNTHKVLLALYDLWNDNHLTDGTCVCSFRDIAEKLQLAVNGRVTQMIEREIGALRETSIAWDFSFIDESGKGQDVRHMNILSKFNYNKHTTPAKTFTSRVEFRFDENIQRNLIANKTRPFQLGVLLSIRGEIASVLYTRLDVIMARRDRPYERTSANLFVDLHLDGEKYTYPSRRKAKLQSVIKQIHGKHLSTGEILLVKLKQTANKSDWKIVVNKKSPKSLIRPKTPLLPVVNDREEVVYLADEIGRVLGNADTHRGLHERFASHYKEEIIFHALSEYKADGQGQSIRSPGRFFTVILHRIAHQRGYEWIKACGSNCKHRPGNELNLN